MKSKVMGFGDKSDQAIACAIHSQDFLNMFTDNTVGFLKADATDPLLVLQVSKVVCWAWLFCS